MKQFSLSIPKPCHENWEQMTPEDKGRFCGSCQKTVVDFSGMSDAQLAQFFKQPAGSVCGRFDPSQLNRVVDLPRKRLPWIKYFFTIALPAFLFSKKAATQGEVRRMVGKVAMSPTKTTSDTSAVTKQVNALITMSGVVLDEKGNAIPHASVMIKGANRGVAANEKGEFIICQTNRMETEVSISAVGYEGKTIQLTEAAKVILHESSIDMLGAVVVYRAPKKKKLPPIPLIPDRKRADTIQTKFSVYPNPVSANAFFTIDAKQLESGLYTMQLLNISGEIVQAKELVIEKKAKQDVLLGNMAAGTYIVRLTSKKDSKFYSEVILVR